MAETRKIAELDDATNKLKAAQVPTNLATVAQVEALTAGDVGADPAGTAAGLVANLVVDDDPRLTDDRDPTVHGSDKHSVDYATDAELTDHLADTTTVHGITDTSALIVEGDARLTDARTPTAHGNEAHSSTFVDAAGAAAAAPVQSVDGLTGAVDLSGSYAPLSESMAGLYFPSSTGGSNKATTPDDADFTVTDIDMAARIAPDQWTGAADVGMIAAKYNGVGQRSWQWYLNTAGRLHFLWSADGSGVAQSVTCSAAVPGVTNGERKWVRVTVDASNGSSVYEIKFWYADDSDDIPSSWTQVGTTTTGGAAASIHDGTSAVDVGTINGSDMGRFVGVIHRWVMRDGIDGTIIANPVFQHYATPWRITSTTAVDSTGKTWTITGSSWEWRTSNP